MDKLTKLLLDTDPEELISGVTHDLEAFERDCESLCFDCGKPNPTHKIDKGVALCDDCY